MPKAEAIAGMCSSMTLAIDARAGVQFKEMVPRGGMQLVRKFKAL
jgi:hypothetical protein